MNLNGTELSEYNGLLQLNNTELSQVESNIAGTLPMPIVVTVADLNNNLEDYESTLIKVEGAIISGGTTFNGGLTVTDATGSVEMYTRTQASFSGTTVPSGTVNITGIASEFNDPQIILRSAADVN